MRSNEKSDVQRHFSNRHRPTFLHEAPNDTTDIPRHAEPGADETCRSSHEDLSTLNRQALSLAARLILGSIEIGDWSAIDGNEGESC
jgi:hypothetical protein